MRDIVDIVFFIGICIMITITGTWIMHKIDKVEKHLTKIEQKISSHQDIDTAFINQQWYLIRKVK
jgi:hypothetical protein